MGVPIPGPVASELEAHIQRHTKPLGGVPGRVVQAANWHVTLAFLGDVAQEADAEVRAALAATNFGVAFAARLGSLGAFPRVAQARVLWIGFASGEEAFSELAGRVAAALTPLQLGGTDEPVARPKPFSSHLTLSRLRVAQNLASLIAAVPPADHVVAVTEVVLFRSQLGAGAPKYERLAAYPLAGAPGSSGAW